MKTLRTAAHPSRLAAVLLAFVLAIGAPVALASPANAVAATLTVTTAPTGGGAVTVTGAGFDPNNTAGYSLAVAPANYANYAAAAAASALQGGTSYLIQPGVSADTNVTPMIGVLDNAGAFSVSVSIPAPTASGWRVFVTSAGTPTSDTTVRSAIVSYSSVPTPTVSVSLPNGATSLEPTATTTVTVTGTGFVAQGALTSTTATYYTPAMYSGDFSGVYVVFGKFRTGWQPSSSQSSTSANRTVIAQKWAVAPANFGLGALTTSGGAISLNADGSFSTSFSVTVTDAQDLLSGTYGVYTYGGGGVRYAPFETYTAVTVNSFPRVSVSPSPVNVAEGTVVTVTGTGFSPRSNGATNATTQPLSGQFGGVYVVFGKFRSGWQPSSSQSSTSANRTVVQSRWGVLSANLATVGGANAGAIVVDPSTGNWSTTLTLTPTQASEAVSGDYGIYTYGGGSSRFAPFETYTPVSLVAPTPTPTPTPSQSSAPVPTTSGYLNWGVDSDFRSYVTGSIAQGAISVSNGATATGGVYSFGQSGGDYNFSSQTGSADYSGSVRFTGHSGALDLTFANPSVSVDSASSGTLWLTVNGSRVAFGTVNLAAASRSDLSGAQVYSNAPVTLTSAGATAFNGFYSAGRTLSPITFVVGTNGSALAGTSGTVARAAVKKTFTPAATPPAKTGITLDASARNAFSTGGTGTITVDGFQPYETGIAIVVYSTPTILATDLTADANGVVTWTGSLPAGFSGNHTLTVQGSISKGIELTVAASANSCQVSDATLDWGFKQSFLAYLDSSIANGSWALDGVTETDGVFQWLGGTGSVDAETGTGLVAFAGSIQFTGHDGVLNTTVSNPQLELVGGGTAYLLLDVSGTTQGGAAVNQTGVRFAKLDVSGLSQSDSEWVGANATAVLTAEGAAAFGTYPEGEELDAVAFTLPISANCGEAKAVTAETTAASTDAGQPVWLWVGGGLLLLVLAGGTVWLLRRKNA